MFTDLEGSTQMLTRLCDEENQVLLASHSKIIRQKLDEHGGLIEGNADIQVRQVLTPLSKMAERTGVAILVIMHLNKDSSKPALYRVLGSGGYVGTAKSVLMVARDKKQHERLVLGQIKSNLGKLMPGLHFTLNEDPALEWLGEAEEDISELRSKEHR